MGESYCLLLESQDKADAKLFGRWQLEDWSGALSSVPGCQSKGGSGKVAQELIGGLGSAEFASSLSFGVRAANVGQVVFAPRCGFP